MSIGSTFLLAALAVAIICVTVSAASKHPDATWNYYHFDGSAFVAGRSTDSGPFLAVRDRAVPLVLTRAAPIKAVALPPDKGALAGICYLRSSGGKLTGGRDYAPCPGIPVAISSGETVVLRTQTDESGYFVVVLPAGAYRVGSGVFSVEASVAVGKTTLAVLQAGKRMMD